MRFSPSGDLETPFVFEEEVVGGAVPKNFFPAVEKGLQESVLKGPWQDILLLSESCFI